MVKDLVAYSVARINIMRTSAINSNLCPKVLFTAIKVNFKKELTLAFGDYCEVYNGTDNTSASRSLPCIALYPNNNSTGSWNFINLLTKQRVRHSHWKPMVTTALIIDVMNFFEDKKQQDIPMEVPAESELAAEAAVVAPEPERVDEMQERQESIPEAVESVTETPNEDDVPDLVDGPDDSESEDEEDDKPEEESVEEPVQDEGIASRTRARTRTQRNPPNRYHHAMASVKLNKKKETGKRKAAIDKADKDEIELLFVQLQGLLLKVKEDLKGAKVYNSHMFTVEKFLASGEHDKFKSRLVFDGSEQDPELFPDRSSLTSALHSLMACLALASANGMTKIGKIDVKGAFIQTEMKGPPIYVKTAP